ncbi:MAG: zinc ribbon domain-containing protein [Treponema sp.]|nr:zinc ribbon domain-containing protein [Treponema sp.]
MYSVSVCKGCGRTIESKFLYCPWCGFSRVSHDEDDTLDVLFNKFEELQRDSRRQHLQEMENQLDVLEQELTVLALSAEMHK